MYSGESGRKQAKVWGSGYGGSVGGGEGGYGSKSVVSALRSQGVLEHE